MAEAVYIACALVSSLCTFLLIKNYLRNRARILLWIALSFGFFALNNVFTCVDLVLFPQLDLAGTIVRSVLFCMSGLTMAIGLTWEIS